MKPESDSASPAKTGNSAAGRVARSAGIVSAAILISRITGLVRESFFARFFGAGATYDAYIVGYRIPNLTRDLFAEGALSSAFVPIFTRYLKTKSKEEAIELSDLVATAIVLIVGSLVAVGMIFSPLLVNLFAPKFHQVPGKFELAVTLTRIMFPFLLMVALAAQSMGILNSTGQFLVPATASTFFNIGSVVFGSIIGFWLGPHIGVSRIAGMAYGVVIGGALQLTYQFPSLLRKGFTYRPRFNWRHEGLRNVMRLMGPAILGNASVQVNVLVNTNFASGITNAAGHVMNGPVSWLSYAFRFMQLPLGLFGVSIASATLPAISQSAAAGDMEEFRATLSKSLAMTMLLSIPSSVGLAVLSESMIAIVYQRGEFNALATHQTAVALECYAVGLAGYSALKVLAPAFYALNDARTPMVVSILSIGVNFLMAGTMIKFAGLGHAGLALSTSSVAIFGFVALLIIMRRKIDGIHEAELWDSFWKICVASAVMGAVCWLVSHGLHAVFGNKMAIDLFAVLISIPLGAMVFYNAAQWLSISELDAAAKAIAGKLLRRWKITGIPAVRVKLR